MGNKIIYIYTDGACRGNPGPGGWGAVLECGDYKKEICGGSLLTTNNIMELTAVIEALKIIKKEGLIDRVIYGSDGPQFPGYTASHLENFVEAMKVNEYSAMEMKLILQSNFETLFNL